MNPFEHMARIAKANAIIRAIDASGLDATSRDVRAWTEPTWVILAEIAEVPLPSVRTREMVANQLAERERLLAARKVLGSPSKGRGNVVPLGPADEPVPVDIFAAARRRRAEARAHVAPKLAGARP